LSFLRLLLLGLKLKFWKTNGLPSPASALIKYWKRLHRSIHIVLIPIIDVSVKHIILNMKLLCFLILRLIINYVFNIILECGKVHYTNQEKIENGQNAIFGTAPWHVGIYRFVNNVSNYELLCGGSLISSHLVISGKIFVKRICERIKIKYILLFLGARCFWYHRRYTSNKISNIDGLYKIAVGKYDRNISIIDNNFTQIMDVSY